MANIKSQKKRALTNLKKNAQNHAQKSELKTAVKNVVKACELKDKENATVCLNKANSLLDKALSSNIKHKNYVARQKAKLQVLVNNI